MLANGMALAQQVDVLAFILNTTAYRYYHYEPICYYTSRLLNRAVEASWQLGGVLQILLLDFHWCSFRLTSLVLDDAVYWTLYISNCPWCNLGASDKNSFPSPVDMKPEHIDGHFVNIGLHD